MPPQPTKHIRITRGSNVRIGPITLITLITVVCMAVMAVLAASTSHATGMISERQASATQQLYANERAAQEFVASLDDALAKARSEGESELSATRTVEQALDGICEKARSAGGGQVSCTAYVDGTRVTATFVCGGTRKLSVAITILDNVTYRIDQWKATSVYDEPTTGGTLWAGA